jgi:ACR3 family arsenite efflux pump ArsB
MNTSVLVVNGDFSLKTITAAAVAVVVVVEVVVVVVAVRVMKRTDRENICSDVN